MNIFNDAARPHDATWLSPFFVVIEFSKAMWQIPNDFKKDLPVTETRTSFARLREVNLLSCLSDGLNRLVHCLKPEACAQYMTAPGSCRRRMVRNKSSVRSSRPQTLRGMTVTRVLLCAHWQLRKNPWRTTTPWATPCNQSVTGAERSVVECKKLAADYTTCIIINNTYRLFQAEFRR